MNHTLVCIAIWLVAISGCSKETSKSETTDTKAHADFSFQYDKTKAPVTIPFTNLSKNAYTFIWNFDDNSAVFPTTDNRVYQTFWKSRLYTITLKAIGEPGDTSVAIRLLYIF